MYTHTWHRGNNKIYIVRNKYRKDGVYVQKLKVRLKVKQNTRQNIHTSFHTPKYINFKV